MKIFVLNTGGTISCTGTPLAPMPAAKFAAACVQWLDPILQQQYPALALHYVTNLTFPSSHLGTLDSTNLQPTDWCLIADYILKHYTQCDGWVVLHGTDSMDFTGTALPFLLSAFSRQGFPTAALSKPVIITGSQVPLFYQAGGAGVSPASPPLALNFNTDAFQNFCGAVAAAQTGIPEVCIYFQNHLYRGNRSVKTNASEFKAFSSPNYPALGRYGLTLEIDFAHVLPSPVSYNLSLDNPTVLEQVTEQLAYIAANINRFPVMQFNAFPAWSQFANAHGTASGIIASLLNACAAQGIKGLILGSYGEGNFPSGNPDNPVQGATYQALHNANAQGIVIVNCTKVIEGVVNGNTYAAGAWLPKVGALNPADMTPMAAFTKLMILLASAGYAQNNWSLAEVKQLFQLNLLGEMLEVSRLDSRTSAVLLAGQSLTTLDGSASLINDPLNGPILKTSEGTVLWAALTQPRAQQMPGRLVMHNDGDLVFYSRYNSPLWATHTGNPSGAPSMLVLNGSTSDESLTLSVYNYQEGATTRLLYAKPT